MNGKSSHLQKPGSHQSILDGAEQFRRRWNLPWNKITAVTAGDVLTSLSEHKVLNAEPRPDYAIFEPESAAEADSLSAALAGLGANTAADRRFGEKVWLYVFSPETHAPAGPLPDLPPVPGWKNPLTGRKRLESAALPGEITPFLFRGTEYRVENVMAHYLYPGAAIGSRPHEDHFRIRRVSDDCLVSIPLLDHYFATAFVWKERCYCFSLNLGGKGWASSRIDMISSDDLIGWTSPVCVLDVSADGDFIFNNSVTWNGRKFVMAYETHDPAHPIFTMKFAESDDLVHWRKIPGAIFGADKYTGAPSLYWIPEDRLYYFTYLDLFVHPEVRTVSYRTCIARSADLIHWQDAPAGHAVILPDYRHRPDPAGHPDVFDINASDAEYLEKDGVVRAYFCGGNQWGVSDNQTAEYRGSLAQFFRKFFR